MTDINQQITSAQEALRQAQIEQAQRTANEAAQHSAVATAAENVQRLQIDRAMAALGAQMEVARQMAAALAKLRTALLESLNVFDIPAAIDLAKQIDTQAAELGKQRTRCSRELEVMRPLLWQHVRAQCDTDRAALPKFNQEWNQIEAAIPVADDFRGMISQWVRSEPEGKDRQIRQGIAYAITGWFCDEADQMLARWSRAVY